MPRFLIDANLPYRFSLWNTPEHVHVFDLDDEWTDSQIWNYASEHQLTIVSKDADFSDRVLLTDPPPRVIQVKLGNLKIRALHQALGEIWEEVCDLNAKCRLVRVFSDRLEGIE